MLRRLSPAAPAKIDKNRRFPVMAAQVERGKDRLHANYRDFLIVHRNIEAFGQARPLASLPSSVA